MRRQFWPIAILVVLSVSVRPMAAQQSDTEKPLITNDVAEVRPVYSNLKERIALADAVIRGRVVGKGRAVVPPGLPPGTAPFLSTEYQIELLEIYKSHPAASYIGAIVPIRQAGGEAAVGGMRIKTGAAPHLLAGGGEFLIVLSFDAKRQQFWTVRPDTFVIRNGMIQVDPTHSLPYAAELDGVPSSDSQGNLWRAVREAASTLAAPAN